MRKILLVSSLCVLIPTLLSALSVQPSVEKPQMQGASNYQAQPHDTYPQDTYRSRTPENLFGSYISDRGFYYTIENRFTMFDNQFGYILGISATYLAEHTFRIGVAGHMLVTEMRFSDPALKDKSLWFSYGGLVLGFDLLTDKPIHLGISCLLGAGEIGNWDTNFTYVRNQYLFVIEPTVEFQLTFTEWFAIAVGASYRYVPEMRDFSGFKQSSLCGFSGIINIKMGMF